MLETIMFYLKTSLILAERYEKEIVMFYSDFKYLKFYIGKR